MNQLYDGTRTITSTNSKDIYDLLLYGGIYVYTINHMLCASTPHGILMWNVSKNLPNVNSLSPRGIDWLAKHMKPIDEIDLMEIYDIVVKLDKYESLCDEIFNDLVNGRSSVKRATAVLPIEHVHVHDDVL